MLIINSPARKRCGNLFFPFELKQMKALLKGKMEARNDLCQ